MTLRLLNLLTALSLVLCVAVVALWVRSWRVLDTLHVTRDESNGLESSNGWWTRTRCSLYCGRGMLVAE
jgi:hypothetical protein